MRNRMDEKIYKLLDHIKKNGDACPDFETIKELTPKILLDWKDINNFLYGLPECDYDITVRDWQSRMILGYYRKRYDHTTDFYGRVLYKGNAVGMLIGRK